MAQDWEDPLSAASIARSLAILRDRTETLRTSQQGADFPDNPEKGWIHCDDDGVFWGFNGRVWKRLSGAGDDTELYLPQVIDFIGPIQPMMSPGGSANDTALYFQPTSDYRFMGQMASASTVLIAATGYRSPPVAFAHGLVVWDPDNTNVYVRFGWFSQDSADPAYNLTPYHMTTLGEEIRGETSGTAPGGGAGTGGSDGPVPRGTYFADQLQARLAAGFSTDLGFQGRATDGPASPGGTPGSGFYLTRACLRLIWGPFS